MDWITDSQLEFSTLLVQCGKTTRCTPCAFFPTQREEQSVVLCLIIYYILYIIPTYYILCIISEGKYFSRLSRRSSAQSFLVHLNCHSICPRACLVALEIISRPLLAISPLSLVLFTRNSISARLFWILLHVKRGFIWHYGFPTCSWLVRNPRRVRRANEPPCLEPRFLYSSGSEKGRQAAPGLMAFTTKLTL